MKTRIIGGWIVGFDGTQHALLEGGEVVFEDSRILFVGKSYNEDVDRTIDATDKLILPGFINIHTHSLTGVLTCRGICEDEGHFLYKYVLPIRYGSPSSPPYAKGDDAHILTRVALLGLLKSGVTTFMEQTDNLEDVFQIAQELGIRVYGCYCYFNGIPYEEDGSVVYPRFGDACPGFDRNLDLIRRYNDVEDGRIRVWLGPLGPDTCSTELLEETRKKANEFCVGIGTHVAQSLTEVDEIERRAGKTSVEFLDDIGFWGKDVIAAHAIHTTASDVEIMARSGMTVAHCASSYLGIGQRVPMAAYRRRGINVVIGTDQNATDLIDEMRLAMYSSRLNEADPHATGCLDAFNAVTLNAAKVLGRKDIGIIAPGARADILLVDLRQSHLMPFRDPLKILIYHANRNDVDTVIVDGQILVEDRKVLTMDEDETIRKGNEVAERIWRTSESEIGLPRFLLPQAQNT